MISRVGQRGKIGLHPFILWGFSACTQTFYGGIRPAYQNIAPLPSSGAKEWHLVVFRRLGEGNEVISFVFLKQLLCINTIGIQNIETQNDKMLERERKRYFSPEEPEWKEPIDRTRCPGLKTSEGRRGWWSLTGINFNDCLRATGAYQHESLQVRNNEERWWSWS